MTSSFSQQKYSVLLLDLDDTLLDFRAAEYEALGKLFTELGHLLTDDIRAMYRRLNKDLWAACESGRMDRDEVLNTRFSHLFDMLGKTVDGIAAERLYRNALGQSAVVMPGAREVCETLASHYEIFIATNGVYETQKKRLALSGLDKTVQGVFVSEAIGHMKPEKAFFDHIFTRLPDVAPERMLMIGDSLSSDIQGGINAGIDTCWFNPENLDNAGGLSITYEIAALPDLLPLLME